MRRARVPSILGAVVLLAAGCRSPAGTAGPAGPVDLQPIVVSTSLWPGPSTLLVALEDGANQPVGGPDVAIALTLSPEDGAAPPIAASTRFIRPFGATRGLYRADVTLPSAGRWRLDATATPSSGRVRTGSIEITVRDPGATPPVGARAPAVDTPTAEDVGGVFARLTSDPIPERSFYWLSVSGAIAAHRPFVFILDSFRFRPSPACGGALGIVRHVAYQFPTVSFIHVEPFVTRFGGTALTLDPPGGPAQLASWSRAWGIDAPPWGVDSVPWLFVVDGNGIVRAKLQGVTGTDELRVALTDVSSWMPTTDGTPRPSGG